MPDINTQGYIPSNILNPQAGVDQMCSTNALHWVYECWLNNPANLNGVHLQNNVRTCRCTPILGGTPANISSYLVNQAWTDNTNNGNGITVKHWCGSPVRTTKGYLLPLRAGMLLSNVDWIVNRPVQQQNRAIIKLVAGGGVGFFEAHFVVEYWSSQGNVRYYDNLTPNSDAIEYPTPAPGAQLPIGNPGGYNDLNMWVVLDA